MKRIVMALFILSYGICITSEDIPPEAGLREVLGEWCPYQGGSCSIPPGVTAPDPNDVDGI